MERWVDLVRARELTSSLVLERDEQPIPLTSAHGYVLAQDIIADRDDPHADLSAMDGFAVIASSTRSATPETPVLLTIQDTIFAGTGGSLPELLEDHAIRIMTGGRVPIGATGIVLIEHTELAEDGRLLVYHPGTDHIRRQGEHHRSGDTILHRGHRINAATIATLATVGLTEIRVLTPLRIAVLPTGDELVEPGQPVVPGQIRESNSWALTARLCALGHNAERLHPQPDQIDDLRSRLDLLAQTYDLIITSGGVSMGDADFVRKLMLEEGQTLFWRIKMKPGSPPLAGRWKGTPLFGLPGNPVSSLVVLRVLVEPWLEKCDLTDPQDHLIEVCLGDDLPPAKDRMVLTRLQIDWSQSPIVAHAHSHQGSGHTSSLPHADALAWIEPGVQTKKGSMIPALLL